MAPKKPKKIDVLESRVPDPNGWDSPEFGPMTAWRTDRMKDMTYSQLWLLIKERRVDQVSSILLCLGESEHLKPCLHVSQATNQVVHRLTCRMSKQRRCGQSTELLTGTVNLAISR